MKDERTTADDKLVRVNSIVIVFNHTDHGRKEIYLSTTLINCISYK